MIWLLRTLRAQWLAPAMVVLGVASALLMGQTFVIPIIDSNTAFGQMPYTVVTPLIGVVLCGYLTADSVTPTSGVATRPHRALLAATTIGAVGLYAAGHWVALHLLERAYDLSGARNALGYAALLLLAQAWVGLRHAPLVPVAYVVLSTIFGRIRGVIQPWAWPALEGGAIDLWVAAAAAIAAAVVFGTTPSRASSPTG
ncbi:MULTISPECIES: hypothetical protein [unclassified Microbacterium]|uniref:hypothetical protein n=1 Tax=unclassified Microbacterium TaxID=2609290 RepID=UPI003C2BC3EF